MIVYDVYATSILVFIFAPFLLMCISMHLNIVYIVKVSRRIQFSLVVDMTLYLYCIIFTFDDVPSKQGKDYEKILWYVYIIWMWIEWCRKYQPAEPEYEAWWRVSEANESQTSYYVKQADIFQYQSWNYSHSEDMLIILKSNINTDIYIWIFARFPKT